MSHAFSDETLSAAVRTLGLPAIWYDEVARARIGMTTCVASAVLGVQGVELDV